MTRPVYVTVHSPEVMPSGPWISLEDVLRLRDQVRAQFEKLDTVEALLARVCAIAAGEDVAP